MRQIFVDQNRRDLQLLEAIQQGDDSAYEELITRHKNYAYTIALRILGNREEAEEVAHDAFIKVFASLDQFKKQSKFTTWLFSIVHNLSVSQKRKRKKWVAWEDSLNDRLRVEPHLHELEMDERKVFLQEALMQLQPSDVTLLTLFYLKEFSLDEIAEVIEISSNNLKVKLFRARQRLAKEMTRILGFEVKSLL